MKKNSFNIWATRCVVFVIGLMLIAACKKDDDNDTDPDVDPGFVEDIDGNVYKTVKIGSQIWMAENLNTTRYNDGTNIPHVVENDAWANLNSDAFTWYSNSPDTYGASYGALYNGYAAASGKLCPKEWRVPTDDDWTILTNNIGGYPVAGGKLKEPTLDFWLSPNAEATNEAGFTALPGGYRENGSFNFVRRYGYWWSSTAGGATSTWSREMKFDDGEVKRFSRNTRSGLSVRCIKE